VRKPAPQAEALKSDELELLKRVYHRFDARNVIASALEVDPASDMI
jgi:hypothetical protein